MFVIKVVPEGIRYALNWFRDQYGEALPIFITENGYCDDGRINDYERISYYDVKIYIYFYIDKLYYNLLWNKVRNLQLLL